jgi:hypothetical protein
MHPYQFRDSRSFYIDIFNKEVQSIDYACDIPEAGGIHGSHSMAAN